jgi:3-isopropylmalate/(R)-2-methylmalate dehydratase small subunit
MGGWHHIAGITAYLPKANVDTDQIIPARFMSVPRSEGYADYLLHDLRRDADGQLDPSFPLNTDKTPSVLIAKRNFGSGSSREAAVYALVDAGFQAVIAPSFGDIFSSNAVNNGLLPLRLREEDHAAFVDCHQAQPDMPAEIDLKTCRLSLGSFEREFTLDETSRLKLINGWDDIDMTEQYLSSIESYREQTCHSTPWAWLQGVN